MTCGFDFGSFLLGLGLHTRTLALMGLVGGHYIYQEDLEGLSSEACYHSLPSVIPSLLVVSPINVSLLSSLLSLYPDQWLATYVVAGVRAGFLIGLSGDVCVRSSSRNHHSCRNMPSVVGVYIAAEQAAGRVSGPWPCSASLHTSPVGLVPVGNNER